MRLLCCLKMHMVSADNVAWLKRAKCRNLRAKNHSDLLDITQESQIRSWHSPRAFSWQ